MFLKGRHFRYTRDDFVRALECFEQAVALRPSSVQARAGLAESYLLAGNCCYQPPRQAYARAREEIDTALRMSPASPDAVMVDAILQFLFHRDWTVAERRFKEALVLSPESVQAHAWYGSMLTSVGRHDEAVSQVERTREIDPVSPYAGSMTGMVDLHGGDVTRAIAEFDRALEIEQEYLFALTWLGIASTAAGDYGRAIDALEQGVARTNRGSDLAEFPRLGACLRRPSRGGAGRPCRVRNTRGGRTSDHRRDGVARRGARRGRPRLRALSPRQRRAAGASRSSWAFRPTTRSAPTRASPRCATNSGDKSSTSRAGRRGTMTGSRVRRVRGYDRVRGTRNARSRYHIRFSVPVVPIDPSTRLR